VLHEVLITVFMVITTPVTLMLAASRPTFPAGRRRASEPRGSPRAPARRRSAAAAASHSPGANRDQRAARYIRHGQEGARPGTRQRRFPSPDDATAFEAAWAALPILTRAEIQAADASEAMLADRLPQGHGEYREIFTSGSTGRPIRGVRSQLWELVWSAFTLRDHLWHRRDLEGSLAVIRESGAGKAPYPEGDTQPGWGFSSATIFATGKLHSLNVTTPPAQQMEWLRRRDPDYLLSHPSILARLAMEVGGRRLKRLRQITAISEALTQPQRAAIEAAFGVAVSMSIRRGKPATSRCNAPTMRGCMCSQKGCAWRCCARTAALARPARSGASW
jgi:hypothetical protein